MNPFAVTFNPAFKPAATSSIIPLGQQHFQLDSVQADTSGGSFKNVLMNTLDTVNKTVQRPNQLLQDAVVNGTADIHEVMVANAQAELTVNMATQMATKVIQAYDRILQIQV